MKLNVFAIPLIAVVAFSASAVAQEGPLSTDQPKGITPDQIIQKFAAKEAEFKEARDHYTFRQDVRVDTLDGKRSLGNIARFLMSPTISAAATWKMLYLLRKTR